MTPRAVLLWLERALAAAGVALGLWCAAIWVEARYTNALPPPAAPPSLASSARPASPAKVTPPVAPPRGSLVARFEAPTVHVSVPVLEGTDDETLRRGAGHIEGTALPGQNGNLGIAGHRDTIFRPLRHLHAGDPIVVKTGTRTYHYRVTRTMIVPPEDVAVLDPTGHATVTLVTCYPFYYIGHAPKRFIVQAELVEP
jgi:sortase A